MVLSGVALFSGGETSLGLGHVLILGLGAVVAVLVAWALRRQARDRRRMGELIERLERLEAHVLAPDGTAGGLECAGPAADSSPALSADVLAGRTSHVRNLVEAPDMPFRALADQTIVCIHRSIEKRLAPGQLADTLCVSLRTLERGLGETLGCTPRQLILAMKMREARRLLLRGARVGEVADRLGFANVFHFSRRFKAFYHVAPSEVRTVGSGAP